MQPMSAPCVEGVELSCELSDFTVAPGDSLRGNVVLRLRTSLEFEAVRLHVEGRERVVDTSSNTCETSEDRVYLNRWLTFTGPQRQLRETVSETITYEAGDYTFPFALTLPPLIPPSYAFQSSDVTCSLSYTATAVLSLPSSLSHEAEMTKSVPFRVQCTVGEGEYQRLAHGGRTVEQSAVLYNNSWLSCACFMDDASQLRTSVRMSPAIVVLADVAGTPLHAKVNVRNDGGVLVRDVEVVVKNRVDVCLRGHRSSHATVVGHGRVVKCDVEPGEEKELLIPVELLPLFSSPATAFRSSLHDKQTAHHDGDDGDDSFLPIPSFSTRAMTSTYVVEVRYPRNTLTRQYASPGLVGFVERSVDGRAVGHVPVTYQPHPREVDEAAYIPELSVVELLEEDQFVFPFMHEPYLPRPPTTTTAAGTEGEENGGNVEKEKEHAETRPLCDTNVYASCDDVGGYASDEREAFSLASDSDAASHRFASDADLLATYTRQSDVVVASVVPGSVVCGLIASPTLMRV